MKFLFETVVLIDGANVAYSVYLHSNGSYYAESRNPEFDNFLLQKGPGEWKTNLIRNHRTAQQIGQMIENYGIVD